MKRCPYCGKKYSDDNYVCAVDQTPLESLDAKPPWTDADNNSMSTEAPAMPVQNDSSQDAPEGYQSLAIVDAFEADRLIKQFTDLEIRFLIDHVDARVLASRGYRTSSSIQIFVHQDDYDKAMKIYSADWKV